MTADQRPSYRPTPITQRDGSALANSNCRMASIATGLDYDTHGGKKSSGAKMRTYTTDQSGGTDSADAAQAWANGYGETLSIRDGRSFDDALADLRAGRLVHLDVWHASTAPAPGICLSGSGRYGHTIAVLPDCLSGSWLVADPWCKPPEWDRVPESKLRAGAEEWGRRVYSAATSEADYPTSGAVRLEGGPDGKLAIVRRVARDMMTRYHPGGPEDPTPDPVATVEGFADTGGAQAILFTRSAALPLETGGTDVSIEFVILEDFSGTVTVDGPGHSYFDLSDGTLHPLADGTSKQAFALIRVQKGTVLGDADDRRTGYLIGTDAAMLLAVDVEAHPAPGIAARDAAWEDWVLDGSPSRS